DVVDLSALAARGAAREAQAAREAAEDARKDAALIAALQARAVALPGSPAAAYLATRGISYLPPSWSYLAPVPGVGMMSADRAALVAWATDDQGRVKGGQRILILSDGSKVPEATRKPAFGKIGGYPARILAAIEGGPLVVCEGPETAASIAQATGFEVWAVFGVGQFISAPVPLGRQVVFCPDRDAPGSPAAIAFAEACLAQAARGVDLWIAEAPEDEGSKRDLNDTLQRAGADAVAATVATAAVFVARDEETERVVLPAPADLPDGKLKTLQAALAGCDGPAALSVTLAAARRLLRRVPLEMSIDDVMVFLVANMPPGAVAKAGLDAIEAQLVRMTERRRLAAMQHVSLPTGMRHDVLEVTTLEALPPEALHGVICLRAPMGKGKTQSIGKPFAAWAKKQGGGLVAICHRVTLTGELARRLDLADYRTATVESIAAQGGVAVCLPSTTRDWMTEALPKPRFVFIDEIAQVLQFLAADGYCRTRTASAAGVYDRLVQIVRNADVVLVADAGLDARSIEFLEHCRPAGERFQVIEMKAQDDGNRAEFVTGAQPGDVKQSVVDAVAVELAIGGKVWLATESKDLAEVLEVYFSDQGFNAISITAANKGGERQEAFLQNAESASRRYDLVIASPAISSGLSIEHRGKPHFTLGCYIGAGVATAPADAAQQLGRVRYLRRFVVGIMRNNLQPGQTWEAIIDGLEGAARIEGNPAKATTFDALVSDVTARTDNARADFGAGLWWMLEGQGWTLERAEAVGVSGDLKAAEETMLEARRAALIGADMIDDATASLLKTISRNQTDELRLEAWQIRKTFGVIDLDDATIDLWDSGRGVAQLERFEDLTGADVQRRDDSANMLVHRRYRAARVQLYKDLFDGFDLSRPDWCGPDAAKVMVDRVMARPDVFAAVGIVGPKYRSRFPDKNGKTKPAERPTGKKATWMVKEILDRAGLAWVSTRVRESVKLSQTPPFLVNTNRGVRDKTEYPRCYVGGTEPARFATMKAILDRRAVFDLDAEIAARGLAYPSPAPDAVVDLAQARNARIDRVVDGYFADALTQIRADQRARNPHPPGRKVAVGGSADVVVAVSAPVVDAEERPAPHLIWVLRENPKPALSRPVLRRYAVNAHGIKLVYDQTAEVMARAGAALLRESVAAWRAMTPADPEAWT
ncbi:MAG: toprim domain-containing protein, partial [Candidatus Saccharibacteria bacterium]|nr:toprim domain-containing protein [Pseudorhodobacter sp.]